MRPRPLRRGRHRPHAKPLPCLGPAAGRAARLLVVIFAMSCRCASRSSLWLTVGAALWRRQLARLDEPDEEVPQDPIIELHEDNFEDMLGPPPFSRAALRSLRNKLLPTTAQQRACR